MKYFISFVFSSIICVSSFYSQSIEYKKLIDEGLKLLELNKAEQAIQIYTKALKIDSSRVEAYYGLGVGKYFLCRPEKPLEYKETIKYFNKSIALDKHYRKAYFFRASCYALLGDFEKALIDFDGAIENDPTNGLFYYNRAFVKSALGREQSSCEDLHKGCDLNCNDACKKIKDCN